jgi:DNA-binding transcriptional MerR regulator
MASEKRLWTSGDLQNEFGYCAESFRVWERQGKIPKSFRSPGGHRRWRSEDVDAIRDFLIRETPVAPSEVA